MSELSGYDDWLPEQTTDEQQVGWGDDAAPAQGADPEIQRYLEERPPHHGS